MMDEGIVKGGDENDSLIIVEVDSAIVEAARETALVEVDAGKTEIAAIIDAAEKLAPEIVKWRERGEMVRLNVSPWPGHSDTAVCQSGQARVTRYCVEVEGTGTFSGSYAIFPRVGDAPALRP